MSVIKRRSTYSPTNAKRFKPIFDQAIKTGKNLEIKLGGSHSSGHTKISDSLKWLILNFDNEHTLPDGTIHEAGSYAKLRGLVKFRSHPSKVGHVILSFLSNELPCYSVIETEETGINVNPITRQLKSKEVQQNWRQLVMEDFLLKPEYQKEGKIFKLTNIELTDDDQEWLIGLFDQVKGCIYDVTSNQIIAKVEPTL